MERYIDVEKVNFRGIAVFDENLELLVPLSDVRKALQMTPTADVVAKSEVERLQAECDRLQKHNTEFARKHYENGYNDAEQEVSRKIFAEIGVLLKRYHTEMFYFVHNLERDIAELEKKYKREKE